MSFVTKKDAILQYNKSLKSRNNEFYLFQEDIKTGGKKQFLVRSISDMYLKIKDNRTNHFYEFWQKDTPLKFSLDMDIPKAGITYEQSQDILRKNITDTIYYAEQFYEYVYKISDIIVLETLPQELSEK
jgi:hypothetical protein